MRIRSIPFFLLTALPVACRTGGDTPQPAPAPKPVAAAPIQPPKAAPVAPAEQPAAKPADPRAERLAALSKEQQEAMDAYYKAIDEALAGNQKPTPEEWKAVQEKVKEPDAAPFLARAQQLLDEDPKDITAFNTLRWMLNNARDPAATKNSLGLLEKYHFERPEMGDLCGQIAQNDPAMLERLAAHSPHIEVRGRALFAKAEALKSDIQRADYIKGKDEKELEWLGADKLAALQSLDVEATQKQIEQIYDSLLKDFADVKINAGTPRETTLGQRASAALYEIRNLAVGKPAPEIEGVDLDSVAFKLSDYRGKVVLLDFWGNW
jgi:hypothetical protein